MDEALIKRTMPNSIEAEQSVIGAMVMDKEAINIAGEILLEDDFYHKQYGILFQTIIELNNEGKMVDLVTLQDKLKEKDVPPEIYGIDFMRQLYDVVATSTNVKQHANIVKEKSILRNIIKTNDEIANMCYSGKDKTENILEETEKRIFKLVRNKGSVDYTPIDAVVLEALEKISAAAKNRGSVTGIPTGFRDLDFQLSGLQPSDLVLIAARPSMGKTAFVLNLAANVAVKEKITTAIFSLEMSNVQLVNRMLSLGSGLDANKLRKGQVEGSDWSKLMEGAEDIATSNLIIDDTPSISIRELSQKCRKLKMERNLGLVIIDYLQLMSGSGRNSDNRQQEISDISRSLKALAREIKAPVIALSQLSRAVEQRPDHRPMLSDLRESGAIEQDADVVMFLYREEYYNKEATPGIAEVIVAKQRNGPIGTINLAWIASQTKFANLEKEHNN